MRFLLKKASTLVLFFLILSSCQKESTDQNQQLKIPNAQEIVEEYNQQFNSAHQNGLYAKGMLTIEEKNQNGFKFVFLSIDNFTFTLQLDPAGEGHSLTEGSTEVLFLERELVISPLGNQDIQVFTIDQSPSRFVSPLSIGKVSKLDGLGIISRGDISYRSVEDAVCTCKKDNEDDTICGGNSGHGSTGCSTSCSGTVCSVNCSAGKYACCYCDASGLGG